MRYKIDHPEIINGERTRLGLSSVNLAQLIGIPYDRLQSYELDTAEAIERPILIALAETLEIHPARICSTYEEPEQVVTLVYPRVEMIQEYLYRTGMNENQLALKADVPPSVVYRFTRRGSRRCAAMTAYKLAKAMEIRPAEFVPAFASYDPANE